MLEIREYVDELGRSRYRRWIDQLDEHVEARVLKYLTQLQHGNVSHVKSVGGGVSEVRIDSGPGYRLYFGREGDRLILLLGGGTKARQQQDIAQAKASWQAYKRRKAAGEM